MGIENKRGELAEIQGQLKQLAGKPASSQQVRDLRRELFKRVIGYMTVQIDMSPIFSEMILNAATVDIPTKKMLYLYITHYASAKPDLALLTINTLQKDSRDDDPTVRGLAIRSLSSLRVPDLIEYLIQTIEQGLKDSHAYPRKSAAMGVLKVHDLDPSALAETELLPLVRTLLTADRDAEVVANCLTVLRETDGLERHATKSTVYALLNRLKGFSEWHQCLVLELVSHYRAESQTEMFDLMNALEDRLQHSNSAVVLATIRVFLQLTLEAAEVHQQVYERLKSPLVTLASTATVPEVAYGVWTHLHLLVTRAPVLFSTDYKSFFCRANDSAAVKKLKLEMLTAAADQVNAYDVVTELSEYVMDTDSEVARLSVRAVGQIALKVMEVPGIVDRLLQFLEMDTAYVQAEALLMVADVVRTFPARAGDCVLALQGVSLAGVSDAAARAALVYLLGEYGDVLPEAPYELETPLRDFAEEETAEVRLALLTAGVKCFLKRPPEMHAALGAGLAAALSDPDQDVHDRALLYYRLLQQSPDAAGRVVLAGGKPVHACSAFSDLAGSEALQERLLHEFNSVSVVYRKPESTWLASAPEKDARGFGGGEGGGAGGGGGGGAVGAEPAGAAMADENLLSLDDEPAPATPSPAPAARGGGGVPDLLGLDDPPAGPSGGGGGGGGGGGSSGDLLGDLLGLDEPAPAPAAASLALRPQPSLDPATFQAQWGSLAAAAVTEVNLRPDQVAALVSAPARLIQHMAEGSIATMASGGAAPQIKFYFYALTSDGAGVFLVEALINTQAAKASVTVKTSVASLGPAFADAAIKRINAFA